jgi:hypothetical protein
VTAQDQLEPFSASFHLEARAPVVSPADLISSLLEDIARRCEQAGCSIIGHIKSHVSTRCGTFSCSLTSRRTGAVCRETVDGPVAAGELLDLDLAVLVYGLPERATETIVSAALASLQPSLVVRAIDRRSSRDHEH